MSYLTGETVLVTGAGGSIGSELCRQIINRKPEKVIMLDNGENALFEIDRQIKTELDCKICVPVIADIRNDKRIASVFAKHNPTVVYHCAAYKHVPLMETHVIEALETNVLGTEIVAQNAITYASKRFVYISTDKAVEPINVMGKSKTLAERLIRSLVPTYTRFCIVRFGNVLGSNGSVIPIFKRQIERGLPVTVTDMNMQRYFMSVTGAVNLVLDAGEMGKNGEVYILDMGEPINIYKLAKDMLKQANRSLPINIIGIRPGEKVNESLHWATEVVEKTNKKNILRIIPIPLNKPKFDITLHQIKQLVSTGQVKELELLLDRV